MTLAVDKPLTNLHTDHGGDLNGALDLWRYSSPSVIGHHGKSCCSTAREWVFATDHSLLNGHDKFMGPRWLRQKFKWGPSHWPITWCVAVQQDALDCGALTAISKEVFATRGITAHSVQLIQEYDENTTDHWSKSWIDHPASTHWINGSLIYHEVCAVLPGPGEIRLWDPSAGSWINPKQNGGYGSVRAVRVRTNLSDLSSILNWGKHSIQVEEWQVIPVR